MGDESADMRPSANNKSTSDDSVCSTQTEEGKEEQDTSSSRLTGQSCCPATTVQTNSSIDGAYEHSFSSIVQDSPPERIESDLPTENNMILQIKLLTGAMHTVTSYSNETVLSLKEKISSVTQVPVESQRLVAAGRVLEDSKFLAFYNIHENQIIYVTRHVSATTNSSTLNENANNERQNSSSTASSNFPLNPNFFGNAGLMDGITNVIMQNMVENPDFLRMMFESNPIFTELRERNPELIHILDDPQMLRQCMDLMRNPSLMHEMTRSADRAMSNIEAIPGGFNALRRMYHNIQEPIWNASIESSLALAGETTSEISPAYNLGTDLPPNTEAMPNPWAPRSSSGTFRPPAAPTLPNLSFPDRSLQFQSRPRGPQNAANVRNSTLQVTENENASLSPQNRNNGNAISSHTQRENGLPGFNRNVGRVLPGIETVGAMQQLEQLLQNVNIMGVDAGNAPTANNSDSVENLEVQYQLQLNALRDMGFTDTQQCLRALQQTGGNINRAIDQLLSDGSTFNTI